MIKSIVRDELFLRQKSTPATAMDLNIAKDLEDTLAANRERCVGMAANMIGYKKRMIIVSMGPFNVVMINPVITEKSGPYDAEEGCLSLKGTRKTKRYENIEVLFFDKSFNKKQMKFEGYVAQIIQHELDHLEGIII